MTAPKPLQNRRPYQRHGLYALQGALQAVTERDGWLESLGEVGTALQAWRAGIIADLGGEEAISAQKRAIIELATRTYLLLESVDRWLLQQPSLVNKSRRQLFPVVLQRQQLADALARYMSALGLERCTKRVENLETYIAERYSGQDGGPEPDGRSAGPAARGELPRTAEQDGEGPDPRSGRGTADLGDSEART